MDYGVVEELRRYYTCKVQKYLKLSLSPQLRVEVPMQVLESVFTLNEWNLGTLHEGREWLGSY